MLLVNHQYWKKTPKLINILFYKGITICDFKKFLRLDHPGMLYKRRCDLHDSAIIVDTG